MLFVIHSVSVIRGGILNFMTISQQTFIDLIKRSAAKFNQISSGKEARSEAISTEIKGHSKALFKVSRKVHRSGKVYKVSEGTFGQYPNVFVKQTVNREVAKNDVAMMQRLADSEHIVENPSQPFEYEESKIFRQVFEGLQFMHGKTIAHRNIRLKNVHRISSESKILHNLKTQILKTFNF